MEKLTEVVETKATTHLLHHVESKPLDLAFLPVIPVYPRLLIATLLGLFIFPLLAFSVELIRQISKGFCLSFEKLQALRLPVLGQISSFCDGPDVEMLSGSDLDLLRKMALFTQESRVISLIGASPDYSYALAENLARSGLNSVVLRCDFLSKFHADNGPGLLQFCNREVVDLPIRRGKGFDYVQSGGVSRFGTELIRSESFRQLIEQLKKKYDRVFLFFRSPLTAAESVAALTICDKAVVTVAQEQTEELTPFVNWAYHEDDCRLTFITRS
jgi:hypothetical protein